MPSPRSGDRRMMLPSQRHHFDLPADVAYLNCAYMGPLSQAVLEAGTEGLARKRRPWLISPADFFTEVDVARTLFAEIVGGDAEGVALVPSVSYGIATAARNLPVAARQEIVVLEEQFPSNVYVWQEIARRRRARLRTVRRPADGDWTAAVLAAIGPRTAVAALPHCHWTDGTLLDLAAIGQELRRRQAALVIDGCQSIGALSFDVASIQPDFLVTGSYKWLLGPYSHGLMWVAPQWREGEPIEHNWFARANSRDFTALVRYTDRFAAGARRFDVGEASNFALLPATIAALRQTLDWGVAAIHATLDAHTARIAAHATVLGLGVARAAHRAGHMIGLRLVDLEPRAVADAMAAARVHVSVRGDSIRVAPHVYNEPADIDRFLEVLSHLTSGDSSRRAISGHR